MIENLTKESFKEKIFDFEKEKEWRVKGDRPIILDWWAPWCGPCKMIGSVLEELSTEYEGKIDIYKINIDDEHDLSGAFGIRSIPTVFFIPVDGQPKMTAGSMPKQTFYKTIKEFFLI
jgi:thioredoxin 1